MERERMLKRGRGGQGEGEWGKERAWGKKKEWVKKRERGKEGERQE